MSVFTNVEESDLKKKIVEELINTDKNLDAKTELHAPLKWASMSLMKDYLMKKGMPFSSGIIGTFINLSFKYQISDKRQGRKEYIKALNSLSNITDEDDKRRLNKIGR